MSPVWILKHLVSVFINACRLLSALPSLSQFGRRRLSLVAISFYALSLLFGPCRLSEFTLAGPLNSVSPITIPEVFEKANQAQFPSGFKSGEYSAQNVKNSKQWTVNCPVSSQSPVRSLQAHCGRNQVCNKHIRCWFTQLFWVFL